VPASPPCCLAARLRHRLQRDRDDRRLAAAVTDPDIKQALRTATQHAIDLGVVGVPTVAVGEALFWGDDRLADAARLAISRC